MDILKLKEIAINKLMDEKEIIVTLYDWANKIANKLKESNRKYDIDEENFKWSSSEGSFNILISHPQMKNFMVNITFMVHKVSKATKKTDAVWNFTIRDTDQGFFKNKDHIFTDVEEATKYLFDKIGG